LGRFAFLALFSLLSACTGVFAEDGTSVSLGTHARGALLHGVALPLDGAGYTVPSAWRQRNRQYGTEEVVRWLTTAFRTVHDRFPGAVAPLGDLSALRGGPSREHRSHGSGRDVDIFFYALDGEGRPFQPDHAMLRFDPDGFAYRWSPADRRERVRAPIPEVRFDVRRNWALVRALVSDPTVEVQWIFVHRALAELMLREGPAPGEDPLLVARAAALFHQPSDAQSHDDHMHVRVRCAASDRLLGCVDRGPVRGFGTDEERVALTGRAAQSLR
jgi:penicillin-insensitive murein endopeptidase